jgi:hypothetical protein
MSKKYAVLCTPQTILDCHALYQFLFTSETETPIPLDERAIPWLGNITFASIKSKLQFTKNVQFWFY